MTQNLLLIVFVIFSLIYLTFIYFILCCREDYYACRKCLATLFTNAKE